jgi:hypothetical protein
MFEWFGPADNITATLVASVIIWRTIKAAMQRTVLRRRELSRKIGSVANGMPINKVAETFGVHMYADTIKGRSLDQGCKMRSPASSWRSRSHKPT